jgi:hypothetical protein
MTRLTPNGSRAAQFVALRLGPSSMTVGPARMPRPDRGKAMKRRTKTRSKAGKSVRYKSATVKRRRTLAKTVPGRRSAMTAQDLEIARLTRERDELLEQQTATAEVLRVISRSSADIQPVFDAMLVNAVRVCGAVFGGICRWDGHKLRHVAISLCSHQTQGHDRQRWFPADRWGGNQKPRRSCRDRDSR